MGHFRKFLSSHFKGKILVFSEVKIFGILKGKILVLSGVLINPDGGIFPCKTIFSSFCSVKNI
jgi:hypothetical protein